MHFELKTNLFGGQCQQVQPKYVMIFHQRGEYHHVTSAWDSWPTKIVFWNGPLDGIWDGSYDEYSHLVIIIAEHVKEQMRQV